MDVASGPLPDLYTAFTTWLSHDWCMLSIILSASSIIWMTEWKHPFRKKKRWRRSMSDMSAVLHNIDLSYPASMNSQETWDVPDISLNSCWCDQPVDLELPQQCLLNCVSCPLWKKNHNINKRFHKVLFKYQVPIWYLDFSLNTAAYLKLLCVEFHNFFTNFGAPGGSMGKDICYHQK